MIRMSRCTVLLKKHMTFQTSQFPSTVSLYPSECIMIVLGHLKSALQPFQRLRRFSRCVLSSDSSSVAYWNLRWTILKPYILPQRLISSIQRTELFPLLSAQREDLRWSRPSIIFDYIPHLVSTSRPFWEYDCLLEASFLGRQQQPLAEAQYSGKFKLKFVRILVTHPVYICKNYF